MSIDSENTSTPAVEASPTNGQRKAKKAKAEKKARRIKQAAAKPKAERPNKKTEVIAMMKRAKGATLPEIMEVTGWWPHTLRGFVSIWARTPIHGWQNRTECLARYGVIWRREFSKNPMEAARHHSKNIYPTGTCSRRWDTDLRQYRRKSESRQRFGAAPPVSGPAS